MPTSFLLVADISDGRFLFDIVGDRFLFDISDGRCCLISVEIRCKLLSAVLDAEVVVVRTEALEGCTVEFLTVIRMGDADHELCALLK